MKSIRPYPCASDRLANQHGVSLVETMVALSLFAISAATVGQFIVRQTRMASTNNLTSIAQSLAEESLEGLRALDYDAIAPSSRSVTKGNVTFAIQTTVKNNTPGPSMKQITVDVSWADPLGTQNVTVHTIYTSVRR
jgi:prepilin-type N-terminal cleavage/methylation domain-containing protein